MKFCTILTILSLTTSSLFADDHAKNHNDFIPIFDGKTLKNWNGDPKFWSVVNGAITGRTTAENPTKGNTFIIWEAGELDDFELKLKLE